MIFGAAKSIENAAPPFGFSSTPVNCTTTASAKSTGESVTATEICPVDPLSSLLQATRAEHATASQKILRKGEVTMAHPPDTGRRLQRQARPSRIGGKRPRTGPQSGLAESVGLP